MAAGGKWAQWVSNRVSQSSRCPTVNAIDCTCHSPNHLTSSDIRSAESYHVASNAEFCSRGFASLPPQRSQFVYAADSALSTKKQ